MRLIDADEFVKKFRRSDANTEDENHMCSVVRWMIKKEPTAYDVDKVITKLEEIKEIMTSGVEQDCFGEECKVSDCTVCIIQRAIEIVKGGGVDE